MKTTESATRRFARWFGTSALALLIAALLGCAPGAHASPVKDSTLLSALQHGGCVILMRHASSPDAPPRAGAAAPGNANIERQLDADGIADARAMGVALKRLSIRIGEVMSSPTFRARETISAAGLGSPTISAQLGDAGHSMSRSAIAGWSVWLRHTVGQQPPAGSNTLIVTQGPNISDAYGRIAAGLRAGGALIFRPDGHGSAQLLGSMQIADWPQLVGQFSH